MSVVQRRHRPGPGGCWFPGRTVTARGRQTSRPNDHYVSTGSRLRRIASSTSESSASSSSSSWQALLTSYFSSSLSSSSLTGTASASTVDTATTTTTNTAASLTSTPTPIRTARAAAATTSSSSTASKRLEAVVDQLVRARLLKEFPHEFRTTTTTTTTTGTPFLSLASFRTLVALSGYHRVDIPTGTSARLYLAEGVVVAPPGVSQSYRKHQRDKLYQHYIANNHTTLSTQTRLFVQPQQSWLGYSVPPSNFVQDDLPLYRLLENSIAQVIDRQQLSLAQWYQRWWVIPIKTVHDRTRLRLKAWQRSIIQHHASLRLLANTVVPNKSLFELLLGYLQQQMFPRKDTIPSHNTYDNKKPHTTQSSTTTTINHPDHFTKNSRGGIPKNVTIISAASYNPGLFAEDDAVEATTRNEYNTTNDNRSSSNNSCNRTIYDGDDSYENLIVVTSCRSSSKSLALSASCIDNNNKQNKDANNSNYNNKTNNEDQDNNAPNQNSSHRDTFNATKNDDNVDDSVEDEMVTAVRLYHSMQPSTRILGLASPDYWTLRHSSASTCVHWGMVLGGAIPLSYRSYHFSLQYPWLVSPSTVAVSVIATITYSIYKWRYHSRTAQASTIAAGLHQRLHARDTAALLVLQHTVVSNITAAILQTYYATSAQQENNTHSTTYISDNNNKATYSDDNRSTTVSSARLIDPIEWALDFGLLVTKQEQEEEKATCHSTITTPEPQHQELLLHEKDKEETTRSLPPLPSPPHTSTTNHNNNRKDDDDEQKTTHNENKKKNTTANHEAMMQATPEDSGHHKPGHTADDNNTRNTTAPTRVLVAVPFEEFVLPRNTKQK